MVTNGDEKWEKKYLKNHFNRAWITQFPILRLKVKKKSLSKNGFHGAYNITKPHDISIVIMIINNYYRLFHQFQNKVF